MKKITFVTGTRADFGKIEPLARAVADAGYEVTFFVTGMHLLGRFGKTAIEVRRFQGASFYEFVNQVQGDPQESVLAKTMLGFSDWAKEERPDLVVIHGDRVEALAVGLVCSINYIPCAHIEGGEVSGTIDESYRHCNSKLCKYHFVSSKTAKNRLLALGEAPEQIFLIGSPEMDVHKAPEAVSIDEVRRYYDINFDDYGIVSFHPVTSEAKTMGQQAADLFENLTASGKKFVVIYPNNDPGSEDIFSVISQLPETQFRAIPSMRFSYFSTLMKHASAIIGNSSLGVREAPFLGVPSLNVGTRQTNRAIAASVHHVRANDGSEFTKFFKKNWGQRVTSSTEYGDGNAAKRFVEVINQEAFWQVPDQKYFRDLPQ